MPNKIKSSKQFRFLEGIAHGMKAKSKGPSSSVAREMLSKEDESKKKKFARAKR